VHALFTRCVWSGAGRLTLPDLTRLALDLGLLLPEAELRRVLREMDLSHSNRVGFTEFQAWWRADGDGNEQRVWIASAALRRRLRLCGVLTGTSRSVLEVVQFASGVSDNENTSVLVDQALHAVLGQGTRDHFVTLFHDGVDPNKVEWNDGHADRTLGCFTFDNRWREWASILARSPLWEGFIIAMIFLNLGVLIVVGEERGGRGLDGASLTVDEQHVTWLRNINMIVNLIFSLEVLVESVCYGLWDGPHSYLQSDAWNVFDFVLVVGVWALQLASAMTDVVNERISFAVTAFRAFHLLRYFEGVSEIIRSLSKGSGALWLVGELLGVIFIIFAILGRELFGGSLSRACIDGEHLNGATNWTQADICPLTFTCDKCFEVKVLDGPRNRREHLDKAGFEHFGTALLTVFLTAALDEWATLAEPIIQGDANTGIVAWYFFALIVVFVNIIGVNLLLAAVTFSFMAIRKSKHANNAMNVAYQALVKALMYSADNPDSIADANVEPLLSTIPEQDEDVESVESEQKPAPPTSGQDGGADRDQHTAMQKLVASAWFEPVVMAVVVCNIVVLGIEHYDMNQGLKDFLTVLDAIFTAIYCFEATAKIVATSFKQYWAINLNKLDFVICVTAVVGLAADAVNATSTPGGSVSRSLCTWFRCLNVIVD
jgi:hypothetical protein